MYTVCLIDGGTPNTCAVLFAKAQAKFFPLPERKKKVCKGLQQAKLATNVKGWKALESNKSLSREQQ